MRCVSRVAMSRKDRSGASVPYWNAFVANLEMHGIGNFFDPRLDDATKFPVAARNRLGTRGSRSIAIRSRRSSPRSTYISSPCPRPSRRGARSIPRPPHAGACSSMGRPTARRATCRRCSPSPGGISIRRLRSASTRSRPTDHRTAATAPPRSVGWSEHDPAGRLLPRRSLRDAARRGQSLRRFPAARCDRRGEEGPGRVPEGPLAAIRDDHSMAAGTTIRPSTP